ncbi:MAG: hypothetical protein ACQXXJ_06260 [Candidatus Bathyarchaeia archaeon]|jgi:hypothetical protein
MPVSQALVSRYFQLIANRQFTEGERELENIKQTMPKTEWNRGYFRALYGIYLAQKNNDSYAFFSKIDLSDKTALHAYRREFLDHTRNSLHGDFDRGYFSAWADCMRVLARLEISAPQSTNPPATSAEKTQLETLKTDKSQATIANFLKEKLDNAEKE